MYLRVVYVPTCKSLYLYTAGHAMSSDFDCGLESRLGQVKHLRGKIEELRTIISEHFAAQLSSACNVQ